MNKQTSDCNERKQVLLILVLATSSGIFGSIQNLSHGYILHQPEYWCSPKKVNLSIRTGPHADLSPADKCKMYKSSKTKSSPIPCDHWDYDRSEYTETAVTQFNLVCGAKYWIYLSQSTYIFGYVLGTLLSGIISDKFGRRPTILASAFLCHLFSSAAAFSQDVLVFNIFRFFIAAAAVSFYCVSYTYSMEIVQASKKSFVSASFSISIAVGMSLVPLLSWLLPRWSDLQLLGTLPTIFILIPLSVSSFFNESTKWLSVNGFNSKGELMIRDPHSEKSNLIQVEPHSESSSSLLWQNIARCHGLIFSTVVLVYIWCVFITIFLFVLMNFKKIVPGNSTFNIELISGLDLVAGFITFPLVRFADRRLSISLCLALTGSSFIVHCFHPHPVCKQICAQLGVFFNTLCFNLMSVYTIEIYPTAIRGMALGMLNAVGRTAAMVCPLLLIFLHRGEEFCLFAGLALMAGGFVWLLPETRYVEMKDTIADGEQFNRESGGLRYFQKQASMSPSCDTE